MTTRLLLAGVLLALVCGHALGNASTNEHDCPQGMKYKECGSPCPPTCRDPSPICITLCTSGCFCEKGTILDEETGKCVKLNDCSEFTKEPDCPQGTEYRKCGSPCPPTCSDPNPFCIASCASGCFCKKGTVLDEEIGQCVKQDDCSASTEERDCPEGMEYSTCGSHCPTCSSPNSFCTRECMVGCFCKKGTLLDKETGQCVKQSDCSASPKEPDCPQGMEYSRCSSHCPPMCSNRNPICIEICIPGCICASGTILDDETGQCVKPGDCSEIDCPQGMEYHTCTSMCAPTCSNRNPVCSRICIPGCICTSDTVLDEETGACVKPSDCSPSTEDPDCPEGMEYSTCGSHCPTCSSPDSICTRECNVGCFCKKGTLLDEETGQCMKKSDCSELPINCPQGKEYSQCTAHCVPTCSNRNPICTRICTPGCICASGTILDEEIGQCVIQIDCSKEPDCPQGMDYSKCGFHCSPTCSNRNPICKEICIPGCVCANGTILDKETGQCVIPSNCSTRKFHEQEEL